MYESKNYLETTRLAESHLLRRDRAAEKRRRLVQAAWLIAYRDGLAQMTLQKVAAEADVALGNVNYYFATKDSLVEAVLDAHKLHLREVFARWDAISPDPVHRLRSYLGAQARSASKIVHEGCQHARLAYDLNRLEAFRDRAGEIIELYIEWAQRQFALAGPLDAAPVLAVDLVARVQGAIAVATTLGRTDVFLDALERVERDLVDGVASRPFDGSNGDALGGVGT